MITKFDKDDKDMQVSTLVYCMGRRTEEVFASFKWDADEDKKDPAKVIAQFDKYFVSRRNVIFKQAKLDPEEQYIDESIETCACSVSVGRTLWFWWQLKMISSEIDFY